MSLTSAVSCGSARRVVAVPDNTRTVVCRHISENDYVKLFDDLVKYPEYREIIEDKLFDDSEYSNASYTSLRNLSLLAKRDFEASIYFDSLLYAKQTAILDSVSEMDVAEVGYYYRRHIDEREILRDAISEVYLSDLDTLNYATLKVLHRAFGNTDLSVELDSLWEDRRNELLEQINDELESCRTTEKRLLEVLEYSVRREAQSYIEAGVTETVGNLSEKLDRGFFKKIFKREDIDRVSVTQYANQLLKENLNSNKIKEIVSKPLPSFYSASNSARGELLSSYANIVELDPSEYLLSGEAYSGGSIGVSSSEVNNIQRIKTFDSIVSVTSIALAFTPWAIVSGVIDIADLALGVSENSRVNKRVVALSDDLYNDCSTSTNKYINELFGCISNEIDSDYERIKTKINKDL